MARCQKITTTTGAVAAALMGGGSASELYGVIATSAEAASGLFIKIYWEGTGVAPGIQGQQQTAVTIPVAGTTVPSMTIAVPTVVGLSSVWQIPINNGGRIWYWITATAADSSTTVLVTGGDVITFVYD
jgi:hypothetical protein